MVYNIFVLFVGEEPLLFKPERLIEWRKKRKFTQEQLAQKVKTTKGTISNYENGHSTPPHETLVTIADVLGVSTDYLLGRTDDPTPPKERDKPYYALTEKDKRDIAKDLEKIMNDLEVHESMAFYGEPMDDETRQLIKLSLENSMRLAKEMAKKKYTPKKYRKGESE
jgi:transcriptional regulator with XRE-family HTH domain